jgi:hypothetical protein
MPASRQTFERLLRDDDDALIWAGWEKLISRLALTDLAPLVRQAHDADLLVESTYSPRSSASLSFGME